jgi:hypothetical protein
MNLASRLLVFAGLLALALTGAACGGHHHHHHAEGTIEVLNDCGSAFGIDTIEIEDSFGFVIVDDVFLDPCESVLYDLDEDDYEIRVFWSNDDVFVYHEFLSDGEFVTIDALN